MDEGSSARANEQVAGRCLFRAASRWIYWNGSELIGQRGTLSPGWLRNRVDGKWSTIDRTLSFPRSPLCPHWCPGLSTFRLSHPTGFTKLKRDRLFAGIFFTFRPANQCCRFKERWCYSPVHQVFRGSDESGYWSDSFPCVFMLLITDTTVKKTTCKSL